MRANVAEREITLEDGTRLRYRSWGDGPCIVFANGLAAGVAAWSPLAERLGADYRFVCWDYRGLTREGGRAVDPAAHARDGLAVLRAEGIDRAAWVGWSLGVQVALEAYAAEPDRVSALVLIGGGPRLPWGRLRREATSSTSVGVRMPRGLRLAHRLPPSLAGVAWRFLHSPEAHAWAVRLGLVGDSISPETFGRLVADLERVDFAGYLETLALALAHDASDVLAHVRAPTLAVAAGRDPLASRAAVERLVMGIAGAEYLVLPSATHFAPIDETDHIALRIRKFFLERGYGAEGAELDGTKAAPPDPVEAGRVRDR